MYCICGGALLWPQLLYTAEMKRPVSESYQSKAAAVNEVLSKLALEACQ